MVEYEIWHIARDFNARVGNDNTNRERIIGKVGHGDMTNNAWECLTNICEENDLVIGGTVFAHNDIYKLTSISPDGRTHTL